MAALPLPPKETTSRELLTLARRIERYGVQRRKLLKRVDELDGSIREAKRMFRALTDLIAAPDATPVSSDELCFCAREQPVPHRVNPLVCPALPGAR